jgi:hypothetical protein
MAEGVLSSVPDTNIGCIRRAGRQARRAASGERFTVPESLRAAT